MRQPLHRHFLRLVSIASVICLLREPTFAATTPGPLAHWEFNELSGITTPDSTTNVHTLTIVGATRDSGKTGNAFSFDGVNDHLFATDASSGGSSSRGLDMGARDWTAAAWVKTTSSGMVITKMGFVGGANPDGWGLSISGNGTVGAVIHKSGAGTVNIFAGDGTAVNDGKWHHIAVVFNRSGNLVRYVDGLRTGSTFSLAALSGQILNNTKQLRIGARDQAGDEIWFNGLIDDARVYAAALTPQDIAALAGITLPPEEIPLWSDPLSLVSAHGRVAVGNRVHVVGHSGGNLVHRSSQDDGANWSVQKIIAPAGGNYPMQYGGLYSEGDNVYLLTAAGDMGSTSQPQDFRKSTDNGASWSNKVRVTAPGQELRRANIVARGDTIHVFGGQSGAGGYGTGIYYFRSTNSGVTWNGKLLYAQADASARMAVDGTTVHVCFGAKITPNSFGGRSSYMRSIDNGETWSDPVFIGEDTVESRIQARQQIAAADGYVFAIWQRESNVFGGPIPADRMGYNRSEDGGKTWLGNEILPWDTGVNRNHQQIWMVPGGALHIAWCHGDNSIPTSPTGYMYSLDYGKTWSRSEKAIQTSNGGNLPHGIMADRDWAHVIAEPGAGVYARRRVPQRPQFTSILSLDDSIILTWTGDGALQEAEEVNGPWQTPTTQANPYSTNRTGDKRFFRIIIP